MKQQSMVKNEILGYIITFEMLTKDDGATWKKRNKKLN